MINSKNIFWQNPDNAQMGEAVSDWLLAQGSLTALLKSKYGKFNLKVISQQWCRPHQSEIDFLKLHACVLDTNALVREVLLLDDTTPLVFARSVIPKHQDTEDFQQLGQQPLGELLFKRADIKRFGLQVCQTDNIWGRRQIFQINKTPLLVSEFFLMALF